MKTINSLIGGRHETPLDPTGGWDRLAPYNTEIKLGRVQYSYSQIDQATQYIKQRRGEWESKSFDQRKEVLLKALDRLLQKKDLLLSELEKETGRPPHDGALEWSQLENWYKQFKTGMTSSTCSALDPRGTVAFIGSYVWPFYHTTHFTFLSLLMGNSVIVKPSEKSTATVMAWAEVILEQPELSSVLQVLVGEKEFARRLACHDQVNAVIFMGSFEAGIRIRQDTLHQTQKEVLLYLGAKNAAIVCEDHPQEALTTLIDDAFLSAGQHCKSVSQIFIHESRWKEWIELFHDRAKQFKIGAPDTDAWMGPLMDESMMDRYIKFCGISEREGASVIMRGKILTPGKKAYLVTPTIVAFESITPEQIKKSVSLQTEILSPHVSLIKFKNYDEVVKLCNQSHYGLCASVWGQQNVRALELARQLEVGEVRINQSTLQYSPECSFQAKKKSGNEAFQGFEVLNQLGLKKQIISLKL